jgi:RNA polymerase sigma-70 factor (ECF subfamily)
MARARNDDLANVSDAALVVAISRYHEDALAEAYRRHGGAVHALASRLLGGFASSGQLAQDVVQEVFLRLWNEPDRYDPERAPLRSFLLTQCHGRSIDLLRAEGSRRAREERDARQRAVAGYDLEHELEDLAVADQVRHALATLPPAEKEAIALAYFGGHTYREVASILEQPEGTIKSRMRSGLRRLRTELVAAGYGTEP